MRRVKSWDSEKPRAGGSDAGLPRGESRAAVAHVQHACLCRGWKAFTVGQYWPRAFYSRPMQSSFISLCTSLILMSKFSEKALQTVNPGYVFYTNCWSELNKSNICVKTYSGKNKWPEICYWVKWSYIKLMIQVEYNSLYIVIQSLWVHFYPITTLTSKQIINLPTVDPLITFAEG